MKKLVLALAVAAFLPVGTAMADSAEDLAKAAEFVRAGDKASATPLLEGIIADKSSAPNLKAQAYFVLAAMQSTPAEQIPYLDKAIAADPQFSRGHERKTLRLFEMEKYAEAAEAAVAALAVQPGNKDMMQYKAYGYYHSGDYSRAVGAFSDCLQSDNRNGKMFLFRGHSYLLSRQEEKALADFSTANRYAAQLTAQEQRDLQYYWGMAYLDANRFDLATSSFNKALGMAPSAERKTDLDRLLAETADKKATYIAMAQTRKDLEKARRNARGMEGTLQKIVNNPLVTNELKAEAYVHLADIAKTNEDELAYADKAIALAPLPDAFLKQGVARYYMDNFKAALESFKRTAELRPEAPNSYYFMGMCYLHLANGAAAEKNFDKTLELNTDPFGFASYIPRARAKFVQGNIDGARADMDAIKNNPGNYLQAEGKTEYYYLMGLLAQHDKKYQDALNLYSRAFQENGSEVRGKDLQKRIDQLKSLQRWSQKR